MIEGKIGVKTEEKRSLRKKEKSDKEAKKERESDKDAAMRVPPAASISVSSNKSGGGGGGGRFAVQVCKISKKALMDDTGGVLGSSLKMKSLTRAVLKRMTREKK